MLPESKYMQIEQSRMHAGNDGYDGKPVTIIQNMDIFIDHKYAYTVKVTYHFKIGTGEIINITYVKV